MSGCTKCDGHGWMQVAESYAIRNAERPKALDSADETERAAAQVLYDLRLASARNSVYPCRACTRTLFFRWAGGHLAKDHDRGSCDECRDTARTKRPRAIPSTEPDPFHEPPPRKDIND